MSDEINAGELNRRVDIQEATEVQDSRGQPIATWATIANGDDVPAKIEGVSGLERVRGRQVEATATHLVTLRHRTDITPPMRLIADDGRVFNVVSAVDPSGRRRRLNVACVEAI